MYAIRYVPTSAVFVVGRIDNILPTEFTASHGIVSGVVTFKDGLPNETRSQKVTAKLPHDLGLIATAPRSASLYQIRSI